MVGPARDSRYESSFLNTANVLTNIEFIIETSSHENWFKTQMFDGMGKLAKLVNDN